MDVSRLRLRCADLLRADRRLAVPALRVLRSAYPTLKSPLLLGEADGPPLRFRRDKNPPAVSVLMIDDMPLRSALVTGDDRTRWNGMPRLKSASLAVELQGMSKNGMSTKSEVKTVKRKQHNAKTT